MRNKSRFSQDSRSCGGQSQSSTSKSRRRPRPGFSGQSREIELIKAWSHGPGTIRPHLDNARSDPSSLGSFAVDPRSLLQGFAASGLSACCSPLAKRAGPFYEGKSGHQGGKMEDPAGQGFAAGTRGVLDGHSERTRDKQPSTVESCVIIWASHLSAAHHLHCAIPTRLPLALSPKSTSEARRCKVHGSSIPSSRTP